MTTKHPTLTRILTLAALALTLSACNLPLRRPSASPSPDASNTLPAQTPHPDVPPTSLSDPTTPTPTPTPIPTPPPGWQEHHSDALALTLYHPDDWEPLPFDAHKLDLREVNGFAWAEVNILDQTTAHQWSLAYNPGMAAERILSTLLGAAREDGTFDASHHVQTRDGRTAWASQGYYAILEDNLFIGVIGYSDRAVLVLGHDSGQPDDWGTHLLPLYETLLWSIVPDA
jgi:hypothetical protein